MRDPVPTLAKDLRVGMVIDLLYPIERFGDLSPEDLEMHECQYELAIVTQNSAPAGTVNGRTVTLIHTDQGSLCVPSGLTLARHPEAEDVIDAVEVVDADEVQEAINSILKHGTP